jgi:hypothetical protein
LYIKQGHFIPSSRQLSLQAPSATFKKMAAIKKVDSFLALCIINQNHIFSKNYYEVISG